MLVYKMRHYFFTLRCVPSEQQLFEDALAVLLPFIVSREQYAYVIEKDNTPDRHLHFVIEDSSKDLNAFKKKLRTKSFKLFLDLIAKGFVSSNNYAINTQMIPTNQEDLIRILGYIYKEVDPPRRKSIGFKDEDINTGLQAWIAEERLKCRDLLPYRDIVLVSVKNAHSLIRDWLIKHSEYDLTKSDWTPIKFAMRQDYYSFADLPDRKLKMIIEDLHIQMGKHTDPYKQDITEDNRKEIFDCQAAIRHAEMAIENAKKPKCKECNQTLYDNYMSHCADNVTYSDPEYIFNSTDEED